MSYRTLSVHVVAFHYVLVTGAVFSIFAGTYFWLPKWTGYMYDETLGKWHFWLSLISVNVLFFPQHFSGMAGMPRRIPDYPDNYAGWNYVSSIGAFITTASTLLFFFIVWRTLSAGEKVPANPWGEGAKTLEWTVESPAPFHTFEELPDMTDKQAAE